MTMFDPVDVLAYAAGVLFAVVALLFFAVVLPAIRADQRDMDKVRAANAPTPEQVAAHRARVAARMTADGLTYAGPGFVRRTS